MNAIDMILSKGKPLQDVELAGEEIQLEWEQALAAVNDEFESKAEQFLRDERVQAAKVVVLSKLMLG